MDDSVIREGFEKRNDLDIGSWSDVCGAMKSREVAEWIELERLC
jgi:hypothetical protein